ncbi:hypothetical protein TNCV_439841 [Trichonephila clavipes]|nr:hypothetical protein TNCV_439841 [Trichonephila clavipes]
MALTSQHRRNRLKWTSGLNQPMLYKKLHRPGMTDERFKVGGVGVERSINTCYTGRFVPLPLECGDSPCGHLDRG